MTPWKLDSNWVLEIYPKVPRPIIVEVVSGCIILLTPWKLDSNWLLEIYPALPNPVVVEASEVLIDDK